MKKLLLFAFASFHLFTNAQAPLSYSATPDSAAQSPRTGSTGSFSIVYSGGIYNNSSMYSICCNNSKSSALDLYRFNINVPLTASIIGITVSYSVTGGNGGPNNYKFDSLCLANNFIKIGTYKRDSVNGSGGTYTHGNSSDLWGSALTPAMVNSPHFGFRVHLDTYGINTTVIGGFKMTVHYTMPTAVKETQSGTLKPDVFYYNKQLTVKSANKEPGAKISVFNLTGKKVMEASLENENQKTVDLNTLNPGIYIYSYNSQQQTKTGKFIVE